VGRERATEVIGDLLRRAQGGAGGTVVVTGEAGIGKSRLVADVLRDAAGRGARALEGRCVALGGEPLRHAALAEILRSGGTSSGTAGATTEVLLERLLELLDEATPSSPIVLVVEDLHWADRATCEALMVVARRVTELPACLLVTCRSDEVRRGHHVRLFLAELRQADLGSSVALGRLRPAEVAVLIDHLAGAVDARDAATVYQRSAGNPLLVQELCAALVDGHRSSSGEPETPMLDVLLSRAERLSPHGRLVARVVATAGTSVDGMRLHDVLADVGVTDDSGLREALEHHVLVRRGEQVEFHHVLMAEAVRGQLLPSEQQQFHRAWAEALRADAPPGVLAHHWLGAGDGRRALAASVSAGDLAVADLASDDAALHYRRALDLWDSIADAETVAGCSLVDLSRRAAEASHRTGDRERAVAILAAARRTPQARVDPLTASVLAERTGWYLLRQGRREEADAAYAEAVRLLPDDAPAMVRAEVLAGSVRASEHGGDPVEAVARARRAAAVVAGRSPRERVHAHYMLGRALMLAGEAAEAEDELRAAAEAAERSLDPITQAAAMLDRADLVAGDGRIAEVIADADAAADRLRSGGWVDPTATLVTGVAASLAIRLGRVSSARKRASLMFDGARSSVTVAFAHVIAGWCDVEADALGDAREHLEMARFLGAPLLDGRLGGTLSLVRAEAAAAADRNELAQAAVDEGLRLVATTGDDELLGQLALYGLRLNRGRAARQDRRAGAAVHRSISGDRERYERLVDGAVAGRADRGSYRALATELVAWRRSDGADPQAWLDAADAWQAVEWPRLAARAHLSAAAAFLDAGDRSLAAEELAGVAADADTIESAALARQAREMAERAGLTDGPTPAAVPVGGAPGAAALAPLTRREREVLELVVTGATNRQIAVDLYISEKTASVHVSRILAKLGVSSRHEAATAARRRG
jgi:DNA-binding CsgD family transcriptional regulator/tetratricopeptide (TPR) repeat protein